MNNTLYSRLRLEISIEPTRDSCLNETRQGMKRDFFILAKRRRGWRLYFLSQFPPRPYIYRKNLWKPDVPKFPTRNPYSNIYKNKRGSSWFTWDVKCREREREYQTTSVEHRQSYTTHGSPPCTFENVDPHLSILKRGLRMVSEQLGQAREV